MTRHSQEVPSRNEDEYFAKQDAELLKQMREKLDAERQALERKVHYMKCPKCGGDLAEQERESVKIDICGDCGGIWLDAGELEMVRHVSKSRSSLFKGLLDLLPSRPARK